VLRIQLVRKRLSLGSVGLADGEVSLFLSVHRDAKDGRLNPVLELELESGLRLEVDKSHLVAGNGEHELGGEGARLLVFVDVIFDAGGSDDVSPANLIYHAA